MHAAVGSRLDPALLSSAAPIFSKEELEELVDPSDEDAIDVVRRINARKVTDPLFRGASTLELEAAAGYVACIQRGNLGLVYVGSE